ncbi:MAG: hypothetical protein RJA98_2218, partial [Pseudomonadota bacterium]
VNGDITIAASSRIDLIGGDSKVSLNGGNIDFITPGSFTVNRIFRVSSTASLKRHQIEKPADHKISGLF